MFLKQISLPISLVSYHRDTKYALSERCASHSRSFKKLLCVSLPIFGMTLPNDVWATNAGVMGGKHEATHEDSRPQVEDDRPFLMARQKEEPQIAA